MKNYFLLVVLLIITFFSYSQGYFKVMPGATVKSQQGVYLNLSNTILQNNGLMQDDQTATIKTSGNIDYSVGGNGVTTFGKFNLALNPANTLSLGNDIQVESEFVFSSGMLNLNNHVLDLGNTGNLVNESENSRAYTLGTGYIKVTRLLDHPSSANPGNLGAVISSWKNMGVTIIKRGHESFQNVFGANPSIARYFDIEPANNIALKATLTFHYFDAELNGLDENTLEQWKQKNNGPWELVGVDSRNTVSNFVLRNNISKFSRSTLSGEIASSTRYFNKSITEVNPDPPALSVSVRPNPSSYSFNITTEWSEKNMITTMSVTNISGQLIELKQNINPGQTVIIGERYLPGIYFVEVKQANKIKILKLIKH